MEEEKINEFGESEKGNFKVKDSIGYPHPYMISDKHLMFNGDSIYLDIERAEKNSKMEFPNIKERWAVCEICKRNVRNGTQDRILDYTEHEQGLLISCKKDFNKSATIKKELQEYLLKIKSKAEKENFKGFFFFLEEVLK